MSGDCTGQCQRKTRVPFFRLIWKPIETPLVLGFGSCLVWKQRERERQRENSINKKIPCMQCLLWKKNKKEVYELMHFPQKCLFLLWINVHKEVFEFMLYWRHPEWDTQHIHIQVFSNSKRELKTHYEYFC